LFQEELLLGKVRTEIVKRTARDMLQRYPDKFTTDFEVNKKVMSEVFELDQKRLRNRVAGYTTRLKRVEAAKNALATTEEDSGETGPEQ
jgi:small subunit ribosomal protein S17e